MLHKKAIEAFKNIKPENEDKTKSLEQKIQKKLLELKKSNKLEEIDYKKIYPSRSTTPYSYTLIKAHKPEKNYPARNIISHLNCPQEALASFLTQIINSLIDKFEFMCKNSQIFIKNIKSLKIKPDEQLVSFDAEALYPSIPLNKCIEIIKRKIQKQINKNNKTQCG